jgi:aspartyl-tRNA(Asn)/glutamyl-tRNA(Gln) amidotransferase subunit A
LRPTFGAVPTAGCFPLAPTFDTVGPMARTVEECARMMSVLTPDLDPVPTISPGDVQVGLAWVAEADPLVRSRVEEAAATFPHCRDIHLPAMPPGIHDVRMRETAETHAKLFSEYRDRYGHDVAEKLDRCLEVTDREYEAGLQTRERYRERFADLMRGLDVVLTPTEPMVAPPVGIGDLALRNRLTQFTYPFSAIGALALALPCGEAEDALPASVQVVARPGMDALVLGVGALLERTGSPNAG